MPFRTETIRNGIDIELIQSLYTTLPATTIMSVAYIASFIVLTAERRDIVLLVFTVAGLVSSTARVAVLLFGKAKAASPTLDIVEARVLERIFAISYFQFACLVGISAA